MNPAALAALAHFLFIVGVSITLSRRTRWPAVLRRALVLVALGLFMAAFPAFRLETLRWPGVLQRIGVCYLAAWALQRRLRAPVLTLTGAVLLVGYWALLTRLPLPDGSPANLDPGMNLAAYFDRLWMSGHLWRQTKTWDPEGLLSTLPAVATTLIGVLAGRCLAGATSPLRAVRRLGVAGVALTPAGLAWARSFPINKNLWTSSYVLLTGGLALLAFALAYWLADVRGWRAWARPCVTFGVNAVFVFAASGLVAKLLGRIHVDAESLQGGAAHAAVRVVAAARAGLAGVRAGQRGDLVRRAARDGAARDLRQGLTRAGRQRAAAGSSIATLTAPRTSPAW